MALTDTILMADVQTQATITKDELFVNRKYIIVLRLLSVQRLRQSLLFTTVIREFPFTIKNLVDLIKSLPTLSAIKAHIMLLRQKRPWCVQICRAQIVHIDYSTPGIWKLSAVCHVRWHCSHANTTSPQNPFEFGILVRCRSVHCPVG